MRDKVINFVKYLLPLIFIAYIGANTLFVHIHRVNGVVIVHSHPFKGHHNHTTAEFETISILSNILDYGTSPLIPALFILSILLRVILYKREEFVRRSDCDVISLRAPPCRM